MAHERDESLTPEQGVAAFSPLCHKVITEYAEERHEEGYKEGVVAGLHISLEMIQAYVQADRELQAKRKRKRPHINWKFHAFDPTHREPPEKRAALMNDGEPTVNNEGEIEK